jgi:hypothetical protein
LETLLAESKTFPLLGKVLKYWFSQWRDVKGSDQTWNKYNFLKQLPWQQIILIAGERESEEWADPSSPVRPGGPSWGRQAAGQFPFIAHYKPAVMQNI